MPQPTKGPRLGGSPAHQKLMLANLATSLFTHGRIHTTRAKAERLRPYAERLITKAKRGDLHNRRIIAQQIRDKDVVHRLVAEIGPFFADRPGGYTRIVKTLPRRGDNAPMAIIELVNERLASTEAAQATRGAARSSAATGTVGGPATGAAAGAAATAAAISQSESSSESGASTDVADSTTTELGGASGATTATDTATDAPGSTGSGEAEVPEPMAEQAAAAQGLDTDEDTSSSDAPADEAEVPEQMADQAAAAQGLDTGDTDDESDATS